MARARNIKPGFFRNADLVELSFEARLLFIGLWTIADREGRLEDRPKQIKMELFPADNLDCDEILNSLAEIGMISRYEHDGKRYLQVVNFKKHQNPHKDERASIIPSNGEHDASTVQAPCEEDANSAVVGLIPDSLLLIPDSKPKKAAPSIDLDFENVWTNYPKRPGASKQGSLKAWRARIKSGVDPSVMVEGVKRYAEYCKASGIEPQFIKQPATFFGPDEHYLADWTPTTTQTTPKELPLGTDSQIEHAYRVECGGDPSKSRFNSYFEMRKFIVDRREQRKAAH